MSIIAHQRDCLGMLARLGYRFREQGGGLCSRKQGFGTGLPEEGSAVEITHLRAAAFFRKTTDRNEPMNIDEPRGQWS